MCASQNQKGSTEQGDKSQGTSKGVFVEMPTCPPCLIGAHRHCKNPVPVSSGGARCCDWGLDWLE